MFDRFALPDVATVARRTMVASLVVGVVGLVVLLFLSLPWAALGLCIGLGMGMANFRLIVRSVLKVGKRMSGSKRRPLATNTLGRLAVMTAIALGLLWVVPDLGLGIVGGMAVFQFILLANVTRSMLKAGGTGGGAGLLLGALSGAGFDDDDEPAGALGAPSEAIGVPETTGMSEVPGDGRGAA